MNLDDIQNNALEQLVQFGLNDSNYIILSGIAGSGKTYTISNFYKLFNEVQELTRLTDKSFIPYKVVFTSTVNKAVSALKEQLIKNGLKDIDPETIYSALNLYVKEDYRLGKRTIECKSYSKLVNNLRYTRTLFIVDEYTYLDEDLVGFIDSLALDLANSYPLKFIFVGDSNQLVNGFGKVNDSVRTILNPPIIKLGKSKRADNFYLARLAENLSNHVENGSKLHIEPTKDILTVLPRKDFDEALLKEAISGSEDFTFIAYHNKVVDSYSALINEAKGLSSFVQKGQHYINGSMFASSGSTRVLPESTVEVTYVDNVSPMTEDDRKNIKALIDVGFVSVIGETMSLEDVVRSLANYKLLYGARVIPDNVGYQINVLVTQDRELLKKVIKVFKKSKLWQYVFYLEQSVMILRTPYATTVHKSQGSTYKKVFIDMEDILSVNCPYTRARLIYVALTRASNEIVITL